MANQHWLTCNIGNIIGKSISMVNNVTSGIICIVHNIICEPNGENGWPSCQKCGLYRDNIKLTGSDITAMMFKPKLAVTEGEDRWLCTLLLQQGYRVEYCAASDSFTYAPEGFYEFFNQRRRWTPSTMANTMDLLQVPPQHLY